MYTIQEYRYADAYEENRYIIVDNDNFDAFGEHYSLNEAIDLCKQENEELFKQLKDSNEEHLHEIARLFMNQYSFKSMSLDEWLTENSENLSDDEKNIGYYILNLF